jgi:hypothetical protein
MTLREGGFTSADAISAVAAVEVPQTVSLETELGLNKPMQINNDAVVILAIRKRPVKNGPWFSIDRVVVVIGPASQHIYFTRSPEILPNLSTEPVSFASGFRSRYGCVGASNLTVQIGQSCRLTVHRPSASDGKHLEDRLILKAESLSPLQFKAPGLPLVK